MAFWTRGSCFSQTLRVPAGGCSGAGWRSAGTRGVTAGASVPLRVPTALPAPRSPSTPACAVAVPSRLEKCCKYPRVRCRGEGFSAPPIASGCSQALFQRGCFSGRALGLLAVGSNPTRRVWFRFQLLPLETAVNGGESSSRARYPAPKRGDVAL